MKRAARVILILRKIAVEARFSVFASVAKQSLDGKAPRLLEIASGFRPRNDNIASFSSPFVALASALGYWLEKRRPAHGSTKLVLSLPKGSSRAGIFILRAGAAQLSWVVLSLLLLITATVTLRPATVAADSPVVVDATIEPSEITIGDHMSLVLTVTHPEGVSVELPKVSPDISPFELLKVVSVETSSKRGQAITRAEFKITIFSVGDFSVPPFRVAYTDASGAVGEAFSPELPVTVLSVLQPGTEEGVKDIKSPVSIPSGPFPFRRWGAGLAIAAVAATAVVFLLRRWPRRRPLRVPTEEEISPEEWARRELDRIIASSPPTGSYPDYYAAIARCIRQYLASRYGAWALACTTRELQQEMERRSVDRWQARVVYGLLEECDSVRWAQYRPASARADRALTLAYEIIEA